MSKWFGGSTESSPAVSATGSIHCIAGNLIADGEKVRIYKDEATFLDFEFNKTGGVAGGSIAVAITNGSSADDVGSALATAIQDQYATLSITAENLGGGDMTLTNDVAGAAGNVDITDTVVDAGFTHTGMSGGSDEVVGGDPASGWW